MKNVMIYSWIKIVYIVSGIKIDRSEARKMKIAKYVSCFIAISLLLVVSFKIGERVGIKEGIKYKEAKLLFTSFNHVYESREFIGKNEYKKAIEILIEGLGQHQQDELIFKAIGSAYRKSGDYCVAIPWYEYAAKKGAEIYRDDLKSDPYITDMLKICNEHCVNGEAVKADSQALIK